MLVEGARKMGEIRCMRDPDSCSERNEKLKSAFVDMDAVRRNFAQMIGDDI